MLFFLVHLLIGNVCKSFAHPAMQTGPAVCILFLLSTVDVLGKYCGLKNLVQIKL